MPPTNAVDFLVVFTGAYPGDSVYAHRVHLLCKGLVENGMRVRVTIPHPTESREKPGAGVFEGVPYQYIGGGTIRHKNLIIRKLIDLKRHIQCLFHLLNCPEKRILVIGPSLDFRAFIPFICRLFGKKAVLEINEFPFVGQYRSWKKAIKRWLFLNLVAPQYHGFITISSSLSRVISQYKKSEVTEIQIPILIDPHKHSDLAPSAVEEDYMVHAGSLSEEKDGVEGILQAMEVLKSDHKKPLTLVITGHVPQTKRSVWLDKAARLGLDNQLKFSGFLSEAQLYALIASSRLAVINKKNTVQNAYCFPTKLGLYLANAVPVVSTNIGEINQHLQHRHNALVVESDNPGVLAHAMAQLLNDPESAREIGARGRQLCFTNFHFRHHGRALADYLLRLN